MNFSSKLPNSGTTIFTVMSALAREHGAINLSQGFPDFDCDPKLAELASSYIKKGFNQYAPMPGAQPLRERIAEMLQTCYGAIYHPEQEICVTAGATQAIYTAAAALLRPGDEVILFEPAYDCYAPASELQGAKVIYCSLQPGSFSINWEELRQKFNSNTRLIILNSPHNPSGSIISAQDLSQFENLLKGSNCFLLSDEVYEHMVFDGQKHYSMALSKSLREQTLLVSSFGKTVHSTGWKIGFVAAPAWLMNEFKKVHQFLVFAVNHPLQLALADYLQDPSVYTELKDFYQAKRDLFLSAMSASRFKSLPCAGTYFQLMDYSAISPEDDTLFAKELTMRYKVAAIPLSVFYNKKPEQHLLRFCFAKKDETLKKAAEILCSL